MHKIPSIPKSLAHIGHLNHHLSNELAKLPEIRKINSTSSRLALDNLFRMYRLAPGRFNRMFARMDTIGLPAHRPYCSPLQALFWLVQDEKIAASGLLLGIDIDGVTDVNGHCRPRLLSESSNLQDGANAAKSRPDYSLQKILDAAWNGEAVSILSANVYHIIRGIRSKSEAEEYELLVKRHKRLQLESYLMDDFLRKKDIFNTADWSAIEKALAQSRWKLFYTVADRLNSPELISYYVNKYLYFRKTPASGVYLTFFNKRAQCTDAAYFAEFMLNRAGYKTFMRSVKWGRDPWDGLHTGAGVILDDGSYLLVSNYTGINAISGPFASTESLDHKLSCGQKIIDRKWGAYYPPRYY